MDDGNRNTVYSGLPKGGMKGKMQANKGGIGSNNPVPYGPKPSFGTGSEGKVWKTTGGVGSNQNGARKR